MSLPSIVPARGTARIVVDLQACQLGGSRADHALRLVEALHPLIVGYRPRYCLNLLRPREAERIARRLAPLVGRSSLTAFDLPMPGTPWRRAAAELAREAALAALAPDIVLALAASFTGDDEAAVSVGRLPPFCRTVLLMDAWSPAFAQDAAWMQDGASTILTLTRADAAALNAVGCRAAVAPIGIASGPWAPFTASVRQDAPVLVVDEAGADGPIEALGTAWHAARAGRRLLVATPVARRATGREVLNVPLADAHTLLRRYRPAAVVVPGTGPGAVVIARVAAIAGVPVAAPGTQAMWEATGGAALPIDPDDAAGLAHRLASGVPGPTRRPAPCSFARSAEHVAAALEALVGVTGGRAGSPRRTARFEWTTTGEGRDDVGGSADMNVSRADIDAMGEAAARSLATTALGAGWRTVHLGAGRAAPGGDALAPALAAAALGAVSLPASRALADPAVAALAGALAANAGLGDAAWDETKGVPAARRLVIDVTIVAAADHRTGIQRVTRALARNLLRLACPSFDVELVRLERVGDRWSCRTDRAYAAELAGADALATENGDELLDLGAGDLFLGLDLNLEAVAAATGQGLLQRWRARGARLHFVVYDVLPALFPFYFQQPLPQQFDRWLACLVEVADGVACISRAVADEAARWTRTNTLATRGAPGPAIGWFHLGADIDASAPTRGIGETGRAALASMATAPAALMVGTIEPRKGHARMLDAFDRLWRDGDDTMLVIAGRPGWLSAALLERMVAHRERGRRLHLVTDASDECLDRLYAAAAGVIAASEGEGFGLPLVEAARHGVALLATDLPVFREVAGEGATYLSAGDAAHTAAQVRRWMMALADGTAPPSTSIRPLSWAESAARLATLLGLDPEGIAGQETRR